MKLAVVLFILCAISLNTLPANAQGSYPFITIEPGPDFKTWVPASFNDKIGFEPSWAIKLCIYYNPAKPSFWGFTLAQKQPDQTERTLLKVWNIRQKTADLTEFTDEFSRLAWFFYRDKGKDDFTDVESSLWLGGNNWFLGDK